MNVYGVQEFLMGSNPIAEPQANLKLKGNPIGGIGGCRG